MALLGTFATCLGFGLRTDDFDLFNGLVVEDYVCTLLCVSLFLLFFRFGRYDSVIHVKWFRRNDFLYSFEDSMESRQLNRRLRFVKATA